MSVEIKPIEVVGLKEALKELNNIDKIARRQITKDFKQIMAPTIAEALQLLPNDAPLSGFKRVWSPRNSGAEVFPWAGVSFTKHIKAFTSGKKVREAPGGFKQNLAIFGMKWEGPEARVFDMAGKAGGRTPQGKEMIRALTSRFGGPSRVIWRAYQQTQGQVETQVRALVNDVMRQVGNNGRI